MHRQNAHHTLVLSHIYLVNIFSFLFVHILLPDLMFVYLIWVFSFLLSWLVGGGCSFFFFFGSSVFPVQGIREWR